MNDWTKDWKNDPALNKKFTTFIVEDSPNASDPDTVQGLLENGESILQMLQRVSTQISTKSQLDDRLVHFETLNQLFRRGVAPVVENGMFEGHGENGYNIRAEGKEKMDFYDRAEPASGFDYYHGATLNLHLGFRETMSIDPKSEMDQSMVFPSSLASMFADAPAGPNVLNLIWHSIGKYIFPWVGKSYEKISPRKLSMFLDESEDLDRRYPERVNDLKSHLASAPHYALVLKNAKKHWPQAGLWAEQLIYSTALDVPFHSSVDPSKFKYQLFGYFLLLDDAWQHHRLTIGLDIWR